MKVQRKRSTALRKYVGDWLLVAGLIFLAPSSHGYSIPRTSYTPKLTYRAAETATTSIQMMYEDTPDPTTFREAEILGLRLMQEGSFEEALVGKWEIWGWVDLQKVVDISRQLAALFCLSKIQAFQKGMKLPGSRPDVLRTKSLSGPSPVGGAFGGTESQNIMTLDDFELQAAHYNMACAHARLGNLNEVYEVATMMVLEK
jgi:hypothetical protein